jgi:hypothetical protein
VIWQRKLRDIRDLAFVALTFAESTLPGQRSWAEIPFGGDRGARDWRRSLTSAAWDWTAGRRRTPPKQDARPHKVSL